MAELETLILAIFIILLVLVLVKMDRRIKAKRQKD
jgi:hypothetical protein